MANQQIYLPLIALIHADVRGSVLREYFLCGSAVKRCVSLIIEDH